MDNIRRFEEIAEYEKQIKELFKEVVSSEVFDTWADTFEIENVDKKNVLIVYHGAEDVKEFAKECKDVLSSCICSVMHDKKKVKISEKKIFKAQNHIVKKNIKAVKFFAAGMVFVCLATAVIIVMCNYIGNRNFRETFHSTSSIKIDSSVRVIQLSDLHGSSYGKDNQKLLSRIEKLNPDIIICTGDMVDSVEKDIEFAKNLSAKLAEIAPSYYIYGNNEVESIYGFNFTEEVLDKKFGFNKNNRDETALLNIEDTFEEELEKTGIKVLKNEKDTITVKNMPVDIYGVLNSNPSSFWSYSEKAFLDYINVNKENLKITAIHEPVIFEEFQHDFWGDLMVCGHTHGGVIRVPVLGPLYTNEGGLLPERSGKFVYGRYDAAGKPLIVSAGLENSNVLRINNEPELVIIDINKF